MELYKYTATVIDHNQNSHQVTGLSPVNGNKELIVFIIQTNFPNWDSFSRNPFDSVNSVTITSCKLIIDIVNCQNSWKGMRNVFLARTPGNRAIRVVFRPFYSIINEMSDEEIIFKAVNFALKKGWKTIIIEPDPIDGENAYVFNLSNWKGSWARGHVGNYLCYVGKSKRSKY